MTTPVDAPDEVQAMEGGELKLKATDRCDRCGAQAYVVTQHLDGQLLWCAHHFREHEEALVDSRGVSQVLLNNLEQLQVRETNPHA